MFAKEKYCYLSHELNHNKGCFVGCGKSVDVLEKYIICCSNVHEICIYPLLNLSFYTKFPYFILSCDNASSTSGGHRSPCLYY